MLDYKYKSGGGVSKGEALVVTQNAAQITVIFERVSLLL